MHSNVKALISAVEHHELISGADDSTRRLFAGLVEAADRELAPQPDGQMFTDEFIGEVIGIDLLRHFEFSLLGGAESHEVIARVLLGREPEGIFEFNGKGTTMGFALRNIRNQIKEQYGK